MQYGLKYSGSGGGERERERESERSLNAASKYASGTFSTCIFSTTILKLGTVEQNYPSGRSGRHSEKDAY